MKFYWMINELGTYIQKYVNIIETEIVFKRKTL